MTHRQTLRRDESSGPFRHPPQRRPASLPYWPIGLGVLIAATIATIAFGGSDHPSPPTGPGWDICTTRGC